MGAGHFTQGARPVKAVDRPPQLRNNAAAYAVSVATDMMAPAIERGNMIYLDPTVAPAPGSDVVFIHTSGKRTLRRLVEVIDGVWKVKAFNPPRTFALQAADYPKAHKVVLIER